MRRSYLLTISLVSASALAYEVLLLRLFSIIQWHHFAFMIISLALLGYGVSGVFLAISRHYVSRHFASVIVANLLFLALAMPLCFMLAQSLPFNPTELLWDPMQILYWMAVYLLLAIPFFFAANIIGLSLYQFQGNITTLYGADLVGAALGSVGIIFLLFKLTAEQTLIFLPCLILFITLLTVTFAFDKAVISKKSWQVISVGLAALMLYLLPASLKLQVSPYKGESQLLNVPGTSVLMSDSSPLGLIDLVQSKDVPLRYAPGLSIRSEAEMPEQLAVFVDNDAMSAITRFENDKSKLNYLGQTTSALPYHLKSLNDVLILGAGAGSDVLQAWLFDAKHIDAVEQNPQMIALLQDKYAQFAGGIYSLPQVSVHQSEARAFVTNSHNSYDLINLALMDGSAGGGGAAGLYSMAENYLYTVEGIQQYLGHLKPDGYLSFTRWSKFPPRDMPRLMATAVAAMKHEPKIDPSQSMILIRSWQTATLVIKNGIVTLGEIERLKQFSRHNNFDLAFYPGIGANEVNHFHKLRQPYFYQAAKALIEGDSDAFIDDYKFNIQAVTDARPYFSQFFKWQTLPEILSLFGKGGMFLLESGFLLLLVVLVQSIVAAGLLLLLPLWLWQRRHQAEAFSVGPLWYFFMLGFAFLFVEMAFIQKFILILHHPVYAVTVVVASFLLAAGMGSYASGKLLRFKPRYKVMSAIVGITVLCLFYLMAFGTLSAFLLQQADLVRYLLAVVLILPIGFFMGMPFPTALQALALKQQTLIPWAWGINGFASVLSPIVATLIAMQFGFQVLIVVAVGLYILSAFLFPGQHLPPD